MPFPFKWYMDCDSIVFDYTIKSMVRDEDLQKKLYKFAVDNDSKLFNNLVYITKQS